MPTDLKTRFEIVLALAGVVVFVAVAVLGINYGIGTFDGSYRISATFDTPLSGVDETSDVKIRGVTIGKVLGVKLLPDGATKVSMKIFRGHEVPKSITASIEPLSVFGPSYLNLIPNNADHSQAMIPHGGHITHTEVSTSFAQLLGDAGLKLTQLDTDSLGIAVHTVAQGVAGLGPQFGDLLDNGAKVVDLFERHLPQALQFVNDLSQLSSTLVAHTPGIVSTIQNLNVLLPTINSRGPEFTQLLDGASQVSGQLAQYINDHSQSFGGFIDHAASVLHVAYLQANNFPVVVDFVNRFFGMLGDAIRLPTPKGYLAAALHGGAFSTICATLENTILPLQLPSGVCGK